MGVKSKLKKIKKMIYKKREKEELKQKDEKIVKSVKKVHTLNLIKNYKPPYQILLDTNFINDCIRKKVDPIETLRDSINGDVEFYITDCVYAELEKLGRLYKLALKLIRHLPHTKLICDHKGTFADDCLCERSDNNLFIVATSDVNLKQRIRKKGYPILMFRGRRVVPEGLFTL